MDKKTHIAYAIHYGEASCGCPRTTYSNVYDHTGNHYKRFISHDEAVKAAKKKMVETDADNWNVI